MDSTKIYVGKLRICDVAKISNWYKQQDKSWIYCDCPLNLDYSGAENYIKGQLDKSFYNLENLNNVNYYYISFDSRIIGFAIIRKNFDYFKNISGYSIGLDIPDKSYRYKGLGTLAVIKLLHRLEVYKTKGLNKIYMETLSYNIPMQKVAEKLGFELIEQRELGFEYQQGFANHIYEISNCLNKDVEELKNKQVKALLYEIDFESWPNLDLKMLSESDENIFDTVEVNSDFIDLNLFDYTITKKKIPFAFYYNNKIIGGVSVNFDTENKCELNDFFIVSNYHECGFGTKALNIIIDYVKTNYKNKVEKIMLEVRAENVAAIGLYWKAGFKPVDYDLFCSCWAMELTLK